MNDSAQTTTLSVPEALTILRSITAEAALVDYRVLKMYCETVGYEDGHVSGPINTRQHFGLDDHDGDSVLVRTEFGMIIPADADKENGESRMSVSCAFALGISYRLPKDMDRVAKEVFAKVTAVIHSWPHWRTFIYSSTAQMAVLPKIIPIMQLPMAARMAGYGQSEPAQQPIASSQSSVPPDSTPLSSPSHSSGPRAGPTPQPPGSSRKRRL